MTNDIEECLNQIELLKQALLFYANVDNYVEKHDVEKNMFSYIQMDSGTQARFVLKQLENIKNIVSPDYDNLVEDGEDYLNNEVNKEIKKLNNENTY